MSRSGVLLWAVWFFHQVAPAPAENNVYGKPMVACGADHAGGCTYVAQDAGAHQVCVGNLPHGFSSDTGQGPWSDQFTGQPWCICIWAYSNYILQHKDLAVQCESIPAKVLEEQYSLDKFKQCGAMSSREGCGPEDIRRSIQSLCQQCDGQATDTASKSALKSKCDAILASAPAAPMTLYSEDMPRTEFALQLSSTGGISMLVAGLALVGVSMGVFVRRYRADEQHDDEESIDAQGVE